MKNIKILVLEGGLNEEHEISIATGRQIKKSLSNLGIAFESLIVEPQIFKKKIKNYDKDYICFNALHGTFGEDGAIQKILDNLGFKYTHTNSKSSHIGFNKQLTKKEIKDTGILTPEYVTVHCKKINQKSLMEFLVKFGSFIIKPNSSGSSFGIKIFRNESDIISFVRNLENNIKIYKNHEDLLVEKFIQGRELTVAVVEKENKSIPIEVTEIIPNNDFFDYQSKYTPGYSKHVLPAKIPNQAYKDCKYFAKIIHDTISCKGVSRSDFIFDDKNIYFLEINTQPGLTGISLVPEQLKYQNISFDELVLNIIKSSL